MNKKDENKKCQHEFEVCQYGHKCKICGRIIYGSWSSRPKSILYQIQTQTKTEGTDYTAEDVFNLTEES